MRKIENIIELVKDRRQADRSESWIDRLYFHRCGVDSKTGIVLGYDARSVSDHFTGRNQEYPEVANATGGENAYSIMIGGDLGPAEYDGKLWQLLPISEIGYHARRFGSKRGIGIGLIFDGRTRPASPSQYASAVDLAAHLCVAYDLYPYRDCVGHGEDATAHNGSKAPGKPAACPGDYFDMELVRDDIALAVAGIDENARRRQTFTDPKEIKARARESLIKAGMVF
jgi:N-acetyl-anhydromuramyl-L-alanine amidase AmpD